MRYLFNLICLTFLSLSTHAQNLVPNGNFEEYTSCPTAVSQMSRSVGWRQYHLGTSDYYNTCGSSVVGIPSNGFGYENAANGNAYAGVYTNIGGAPTAKEYIARTIPALKKNHSYTVSLSVSLAESSGLATSDLGIWFYKNGPTSTTSMSGTCLPVTPQISYASYGPIITQSGWLRLSKEFIADSSYENIVIGGFVPNTLSNIIQINSSSTIGYYYLDSIVIKPTTNIHISSDKRFCTGDTMRVSYSIFTVSGRIDSTNFFTLHLSDSGGNFNSLSAVDTIYGTGDNRFSIPIPFATLPSNHYRLRVISSSSADTSNVLENVSIGNVSVNKPLAYSNTPVCFTDTLSLFSSSTTPNVNYYWTGPGNFSSNTQNCDIINATNKASGDYIVTASLFGCIATDTITCIVVADPITIIATANIACDSSTLEINGNAPYSPISYSWSGPNSFYASTKNIFISKPNASMSGVYTFTAHYDNCYNADTAAVQVRPSPAATNTTSNSPVCAGDSLGLQGYTSSTGVIFQWSGPNGFASSLQNPNLSNSTTASTGAYILTYNKSGCVIKDTLSVIVNQAPLPVIATANTPVCTGNTLNLSSTTSTTGAGYTWTGPNSFSSTTQNPVIPNTTIVQTGDYIITAALANGCMKKDTVTIAINPLPANINATTNAPICADNMLNITATTTSTGVSFSWTGPNSFASPVQAPSFTNAQPVLSGDYYVTFTLNGCVVKDTVSVIVNQAPLPVIASANTPVCERNTLNLNSTTSTTGAVYTWTGPNSFTSTTQSPVINNSTLVATGDYIITASLANGCSKKDTVSVVIKPLPANFNATTNAPICAGNVLNISAATSSTGVSFSWTGPNSFTSSFQAPSFTNAQAGLSGDYIVTGTLNGCTIKDTVTVVVTAIPAKPTAGVNNPVCAGQSINLTATTISGVGYIWVGPGAYSSTLQNPVLPNAGTGLAGKYWVKTTVNGCTSANDTIQVNIIAAPFVGIYPSPKDTICAGATILMIATPTGAGTGPQYQWYRNNVPVTGATTTSLSTNAVNDKDVFYCTMLSTAVCANPYTDTSNAITMTVMPWLVPAVSIAATPNTPVKGGEMISFTATPVNGGKTPQYQWKRNGKDVIGALSNLWGANNLSDRDTICAVLISSYMCPSPATAKSNCIVVNINTTGIAGTAAQDNLNIYPNPVGNELVIEGLEPKTTIQLFDVLGRQVYNGTYTTTTTKINTAHLVPGTYMLQLTSNDKRTAVKVVKE